jgi:hypothetical protein
MKDGLRSPLVFNGIRVDVQYLISCVVFYRSLFVLFPSVFSKVYLPVSLDCLFVIAPSVFSNVYLPVSLDCLFVIAPSVFSNVYCLYI